MPRLQSPYYESDVSPKKGSQKHVAAPVKMMTGPEIGENWTRQFVSTQASFIKKYQSNPKLNASWFLALAACMANDDTTQPLLEQAHQQGLPTDELFRIAASLDSPHAISFMMSKGVDFGSLKVQPEFWAEIGFGADANMPSRYLIDHLLDPRSRPKSLIVSEVFALEALVRVSHHKLPEKMIDEMVRQGAANGSTRIETQAFGFEEGHASWASIAIANGNAHLAAKLLGSDTDISQDLLDEALLAIAMTVRSVRLNTDEVRAMSNLASLLAKSGANPDRPFRFNQMAYADLRGWQSANDDKPLELTARQWAVAAHMKESKSTKFVRATMPSPWPARAGTISWVEFVGGWVGRGLSDDSSSKQMLDKALAVSSKENPVQVEKELRNHWISAAKSGDFVMLDSLLDSAVMKKMNRQFDPDAMDEIIKEFSSGLSSKLKPQELVNQMQNWWGHDRLKRILEWIPEDRAQVLQGRLDEFNRLARSYIGNIPIANVNERDLDALKMALENLGNSPSSAHMTPSTKRRTL